MAQFETNGNLVSTEESVDTTLLSYVPATIPSPLQVTAGGHINLTIPVPSSTVYCEMIALIIPYGRDSNSLCNEQLNTSNISITPSRWDIGPGDAQTFGLTGNYDVFVLTPKTDEDVLINYKMTISIGNFTVNDNLGNVDILLKEKSAAVQGAYTMKSGGVTLVKGPYDQFYVQNFLSQSADQTETVITEVAYNQPVLLSWEGSENSYSIIYDDLQPVPVQGNSWTSPNLLKTTTFILHATQQASGTANDPQTLHIYRTITVVVKDPDVLAHSLHVEGASVLTGGLTVNNTANITGASTLAATTAASLNVTANASVGGTLNVKKDTTLGGMLSATGNVSTNAALGGNAATFLFANGFADGTTNAVLRKDPNNAYIWPWGTGTANNGVVIGGGVNTDLIITGNTAMRQNASVGGSISIGTWNISVDASNNLCFTNNAGNGALLVGGQQVIKNGDPCHINNDQGTLNGTTHTSVDGDNWQATTYWMSPPDGDSNLTINFGNAV